MIDLSFVILTWNSNNHLACCLDSFISQCQKENISWEIIIVDNGANDGTCQLVKKYCKGYSGQIHLLSLKENFGTTYPRNLGLKNAKGNTCCILDSDTEFNSGFIQNVINALNDENIGIIAPKLLLHGEMIQNSVKKFSTFLNKLSTIPGIIFNKK